MGAPGVIGFGCRRNLITERSTRMNDIKYVGMDVHQASIVAVVLDGPGKVVMESILETRAEAVLQFVCGLSGTLWVTFEEGVSAGWLHDLVKLHAARVVVCDPRKNALLKSGNKAETGRRDFRLDEDGGRDEETAAPGDSIGKLDVHPDGGGLQPGAHSESGHGNSHGERLRSSVFMRSEKAKQGHRELKTSRRAGSYLALSPRSAIIGT